MSNLIFQKNRTRRNQWKNHPTHEYFYPYHHPLPLYRLYQRLTSRLSASRNSLGWKFLHEWAKNRAPSRPTEEGKREQSVGKRGGCEKHRERETTIDERKKRNRKEWKGHAPRDSFFSHLFLPPVLPPFPARPLPTQSSLTRNFAFLQPSGIPKASI